MQAVTRYRVNLLSLAAIVCCVLIVAWMLDALGNELEKAQAISTGKRKFTVVDATGHQYRNLMGDYTRSSAFRTSEGKEIVFHGSFTVIEE